MTDRLLAKLITEHYDTAATTDREFSIESVISDVLDDPTLDSCRDEVMLEAVRGGVRKVDRTRTRLGERTLFDTSDQVVALGENRRRRRGSMVLADVQVHLGLVDTNAAAVAAAQRREHEWADRLVPLMADGTTTWDTALAATIEAQQ